MSFIRIIFKIIKLRNKFILLILYLFFIFSFIDSKISPNIPQPQTITSPIQQKEISKDKIKVLTLEINSSITNATTWYLQNKISKYKNNKDIDFILIYIDSEGGLISSMREIVNLFFSSDKPIIAYVYPKGSRAASAAMFILIGAHVAVMADTTNTGASTPLISNQDQVLKNKVIQDLLAFSRNICNKRNKNYEAIEKAVINATSYTEQEALKNKIIDFIANSPNEIFQNLLNKPILLDNLVQVTLKKYNSIEYIKESPNFIEKMILVISEPSIAYFLLNIGFWAIIIELSHPGLIAPLVVGVIALSLGFFGLGMISANTLGTILIIFSFILFLLELKFQTYGILTITALTTFIIGSVLLFKNLYQPLPIIPITFTTTLILSIFSYIAYIVLFSNNSQKNYTIGEKGKIVKLNNNEIIVNIDGVLWKAKPKDENQEFYLNELVKINKILENLVVEIEKMEDKR